MILIGYLSGGLLMADAIGNIGTAGHNWGLEATIGLTLLSLGFITRLLSKGRI